MRNSQEAERGWQSQLAAGPTCSQPGQDSELGVRAHTLTSLRDAGEGTLEGRNWHPD